MQMSLLIKKENFIKKYGDRVCDGLLLYGLHFLA